jgi:hypothetical protein
VTANYGSSVKLYSNHDSKREVHSLPVSKHKFQDYSPIINFSLCKKIIEE